jgi:hypothetical protein
MAAGVGRWHGDYCLEETVTVHDLKNGGYREACQVGIEKSWPVSTGDFGGKKQGWIS